MSAQDFIPDEGVPDAPTFECHECGTEVEINEDTSSFTTSRAVRVRDNQGYWHWSITEVTYCEDCYSLCYNCDTEIAGDDIMTSSHDDRQRCEDCYNERHTECARCGDEVWHRDVYNYDDESYCEGCYDSMDHDDYESDDHYDRGPIRSYSTKFSPVFRELSDSGIRALMTPRRDVPYMGWELETNMKGDAGRDSRINGANMLIESAPEDYIMLKEDGSITGFEIVTHPATYDAHLAMFPWDALRRLATEFGQSSWRGAGAGLHVHISKGSFSKFHLGKFLQFHDKNATQLIKLAGRDSSYSKFGRTTNNSWGDNIKANRVRQALGKEVNNDRYVAVNLQNHHTVELRYFRGSLLPSTVKGVLEFTHSVWAYTRDVKCTNIKDHANILWPAYREWVTTQADTYPHANQLIITRGL